MARVFAVASAKGGVGKTTTTANVGAMLAGTGADVVVIDGDIGMANLGAALGIDAPAKTLHDVLSGEATPSEATYEGPGGVYVVPGATALSAYAEADPGELQSVVNVHAQADYVLIDVGAGISHETSLPLSVADDVLLVSTPERDALRDTEKTRQLTNQLGGSVVGAIITRTEPSTPISELVTGTLGTEVLATIPEDEAVPDALAVGEPLSDYAPHSPAADGYRELVTALTDREPERPPEPTQTVDASAGDEPQTTVASSETVDEDTSATAEEKTETTAASTEADRDETTATDPGSETGEGESGSGTGQRPPDDLESKWAEAATGGGADTDDTTGTEETTTSIAEATAVDDDSPEPEVGAEDTDSAPTTADRSETVATGDTETERDVADTAATDESDGDEQATGSDSMQPESAGPPASADSADQETQDRSVDDSIAVPDAETTEDESDGAADDDDGVAVGEPMDAAEEATADGTATTDADSGEQSVGDDAIPFREEADETADEDVGDPVEPQPEDEEPMIPDAEGDDSGSAVPTELMGGRDDDDPDEDEDDEESKGFLRRLLFG